MEIRNKESLFIIQDGKEYVVRQGTVGVERKRIVFFYDTTRTAAVGYSRDFCLDSPDLFSVSRNLTDKDVSLRDVKKVVEKHHNRLSPDVYANLLNELETL
jgi:hypothetical protein|nr:MAG: hypothetical protein [Bacteriophage sp.]